MGDTAKEPSECLKMQRFEGLWVTFVQENRAGCVSWLVNILRRWGTEARSSIHKPQRKEVTCIWRMFKSEVYKHTWIIQSLTSIPHALNNPVQMNLDQFESTSPAQSHVRAHLGTKTPKIGDFSFPWDLWEPFISIISPRSHTAWKAGGNNARLRILENEVKGEEIILSG